MLFTTLLMVNFFFKSWKITKIAKERNETKRIDYTNYVGRRFIKEQLVFFDETGVNSRNTDRKRGYAKKGSRAIVKTPHSKGKK
jgi:hypothetical protein